MYARALTDSDHMQNWRSFVVGDSILYAASVYSSVWKSVDGGQTWNQASFGLRSGFSVVSECSMLHQKLLSVLVFTLASLAAPVLAQSPIFMDTAEAVGISFEVSNPSLTTRSGGTVTFDGTITNNSGGDLFASDFSFNFFGFNPDSVSPIQDLGVTTDFLIVQETTSPQVALFDVALGRLPVGSNFLMQVQLEDINSQLSGVQTVMVQVRGSAVTPEPATIILFGTGLLAIAVRRKLTHAR
jgi:hypothetical protein